MGEFLDRQLFNGDPVIKKHHHTVAIMFVIAAVILLVLVAFYFINSEKKTAPVNVAEKTLTAEEKREAIMNTPLTAPVTPSEISDAERLARMNKAVKITATSTMTDAERQAIMNK